METMTDLDLLMEVEQAICTVFRVSGPGIQPNTTLVGDLGAESIAFLRLACDLEKIFNFRLDFRRLLQEKKPNSQEGIVDLTIQEVVDHLKTRLPVTFSANPIVVREFENYHGQA
ncbi:MAG TPA: acyl carrier protein [Candidatus Angelobacter sp.]|nr:acyl carrier protein [Candidatus Angelobacter sp.]